MSASRITIGALRKNLGSVPPFACLTCYDATTARWLVRSGVQSLLVGDTAAEMILGHPRTVDMPLEIQIALTAAVRRGVMAEVHAGAAQQPLIMGDMPFLSYHLSEDQAIANAARFITEGQADIVKLEVDATFASRIDRMNRAGIPICAHIGSRPQRFAMTGGYSAAGRTEAEANQIVADARAMVDAGCPMMLVEAVPDEVATRILALTRPANVPLIGIGAGIECDGQVLVINDLLGLTDNPPAFVKRLASVGPEIQRAGNEWVKLVAAKGVGPSPYKSRVMPK